MMIYLVLFIVPMLLGLWAQRTVTSTFARYAQVPSGSGLSGAQVARQILDRNGLSDVQVQPVAGELSDHYDPRTRTVNLSEPVFAQRTVSAVSVAAHETGHALQHQAGYVPMSVRAALVPAANFGQSLAIPLIMIGIVLAALMRSPLGIYAGIAGIVLYAFAVLFHIVTLPVEFNASRRAKRQLADMGIAVGAQGEATAKVLNAAALTYVAGALAAIAQLLYFAMMFLGGNRN